MKHVKISWFHKRVELEVGSSLQTSSAVLVQGDFRAEKLEAFAEAVTSFEWHREADVIGLSLTGAVITKG